MKQVVPLLTRQEGEADPRTGEGIITPGDFTLDEKSHQIFLTEQGHEKAEAVLAQMGLIPEGASLYDPANITLMHHLNAALRAQHLYHRDQHYVVQEGEIVIVDEFTGRLMTGRRWSDGLHQAVEAKEDVQIQAENQTLASITFQNYFRLYNKIGGMTGTADTEAYEFQEIYGLETMVIPPHRKSQREDQLDRVYKTSQERYNAAITDIRECHERGQPVLVGTTSIENSELIAQLLTQEKLPHQVLNAKQHAREADIVAQAGRPGSRSPPTWPVVAPTSCWVATSKKTSRPLRPTKACLKMHAKFAWPSCVSNGKWCTNRSRLWAVCASSPPNAMSRAALTTNCVAVRAARATPALHVST
jgi:preprotein translocase subunit SecA